MCEEICTRFGWQPPDELSNSSSQRLLGTFGAFAQKRLEHTIRLLDRVEVWRVWREVAQRSTGGFDYFTDSFDLVSCDVVHDDNISAFERGNQTLLDIGQK